MENSPKNKEKKQSPAAALDDLVGTLNLSNFIKEEIAVLIESVYGEKIDNLTIEHPGNEKWGEYSSNAALILAPKIEQSAIEIAKKLSYELQSKEYEFVVDSKSYKIFEKIDFAQPGFINFKLSAQWLHSVLLLILQSDSSYKVQEKNEISGYGVGNLLSGKKVVIEYTDPNPFKIFHIGHLMSNCIGESLSRLLEFQGAEIRRVNYQGDVGLHVAQSIWGMKTKSKLENISLDALKKENLKKRVEFLGESYALGATKYKEDKVVKKRIDNLNAAIFKVAQKNLKETENWEEQVEYPEPLESIEKFILDAELKEFYVEGRKWSLELFEKVYQRLGTDFDEYYFESKVGEYGYMAVMRALKEGVFEKDQGAVIFRGEKYDLHTRVFINSMGLPTYEAKDFGLAKMKYDDSPYDLSLIVTANEINDYFKVVLKAMEFVYPELSEKTHHIGHGIMELESGKMSSRTGNIIGGIDLVEEVRKAVEAKMVDNGVELNKSQIETTADNVAIGALKYDILKQNIGKNIIFSWERSLSLQGNTGPYLQYTHSRACSVLDKADIDMKGLEIDVSKSNFSNEQEERLLKWLYRFPEAVQKAAKEISPNTVCDYLSELSHRFNSFYAETPILNSPDESTRQHRILLTKCVKDLLETGLYLLGIEAPSRM